LKGAATVAEDGKGGEFEPIEPTFAANRPSFDKLRKIGKRGKR
jgi:hypothetical protein